MKERSSKHLRKADAVGLIRDERHGRLLIRYRTVTLKQLELKTGVLGLAKHFGTGADNISKATVKLMIDALTPNTGMPDTCRRSADESVYDDDCRHSTDKDDSDNRKDGLATEGRHLADSVLHKVEMLCVDSASDELLSGHLMRYGEKMTQLRMLVSLLI